MPDAEASLGYEILTPDATTPLRVTKFPVDGGGNPVPCLAFIQCAKLVNASTKGNVGVRWTDDGTAPTKDVGMEMNPGDRIETVTAVSQLRFIGVAVNAQINIRYSPFPRALNMFQST